MNLTYPMTISMFLNSVTTKHPTEVGLETPTRFNRQEVDHNGKYQGIRQTEYTNAVDYVVTMIPSRQEETTASSL